jgi:cell division protein FtsI/penicillin-binding protein 2
MNGTSKIRVRIILGAVAFFALVLVGKLYSVQIVHGDEFQKKADRQYAKPNTVLFDRGSVFFKAKDGTQVGAATTKDGFTIALTPSLIKNASAAYEAVAKITPIDKRAFLEKAAKKDDPYEEIKKKVARDQGLAIGALNIPGVRVYKDTWRVYPGATTAAHEIGLVGFKGNEVAGRYGLESYYEDVLSRTTDGAPVNFFAEIFTDIKKTVFTDESIEGDVVTSIEPSVQNYLEKKMAETKEKWKSDSIGGIIINPNTGAIYAMGSLPSFNPNDVSNVKDPAVFSNALVESNYEMGSIIKPLTMAAGLDSGAVKPESTYNDKGFIELNKKRINNWDGKAHGVIPMQEILSQSLNVGSAYIVSKIGNEKFKKYFQSFGIGELTGIDQPNEQKGLVKNLESGRDVEYATAAFGQGIAMTPIATVRALSVLANGGKLLRPHIAETIEYSLGTSKKVDGGTPLQVISPETADEVTRMLVVVVDKVLKKGAIKMDHYSIAAKTGTAQIADHVNGGYYKDRYLHSFFGYFPAYKPQFLVFLYHYYPKDVQYASETLTDPFIDITKFLISYYQIPPDR